MLHCAQRGLTHKRATFTNLLVCDAHDATLLSINHAFDIISFDFVKPSTKCLTIQLLVH